MPKERRFSLLRSSFSVSLAMLIAKVLSFVRDMLIAQELGATTLSDAVLLSTTLLLLLVSFIRSPFAASYLPIATDVYLKKGEKDKLSFFGNVYGMTLVLGCILAASVFVFINQLISVLAPGLSSEGKDILRQLMIFQLPVIPLSLLGAVNDGNLKLLNRFGVSEISSALLASFYIAYFIIWHNKISVIGLSICVLVAYFTTFILRYSIIMRDGIKAKWKFDFWKSADVRSIGTAMIPFILATGAKELNALIDKAVASLLDTGSITMQTYASKLTVTEVGLIATAIGMVIYAQASKDNTFDNKIALKKTVVSGLKFVNTLMFPCCILTIVYSKELITILFGRGAFNEMNVSITANTMIIYAVGMFGSGIEEVLTRTMHATKHRKYPAIVSGGTVCINTVLNLLLYRRFGIYGLAAASSFVLLLKVPLYIIYVNKNIVSFEKEDHVFKDALCIAVVSLIAGILSNFVKQAFSTVILNQVILLLIGASIGFLFMLIGLLCIRNEYAILFTTKLRSMINKGGK